MRRRSNIVAAALGLLVGLAPLGVAQAAWRKAESEHFIVYGRSERSVREYATMLEDFDGLLRRLHGRTKGDDVQRKLPIYLVPTLSELRRVAPHARENTAGIYFPTLTEVFTVVVRDGATGEKDQNRGDDTAFHEYVHHFMLQYYPSAYPAWLVEGYAEYYMTANLKADRLIVGDYNRGRAITLMAPGQVWIPMEDVLGKRPGDLGKWDTLSYYAQSWLLTHYILSDPERRAKLPPYLDAVRDGRDPVAAWKDVFGEDPAALTTKLRRYLNKPLAGGMLQRTEPLNPKMTISTLSEGADDLLLESQRLKLGVPKDDRSKFLASIRSAAGKAPNDRFARLTLARAETQIGDRAAGQAILTALLAADPNDEEALTVLGESHLAIGYEDEARRKEAFGEARKLFARAFKINPDNPQTLHGYADSRALEPLSDNLINVRLKAMELAPQVGHLRLDAAQALIQTREFDAARAVLTPLASNPHGGGEVEAARTLLKSLPPPASAKSAAQDAPKPEGDKKG